MTSRPYDLTGLILVGGASSRMGRPKTDLKLGDCTLIERVQKALASVCREIILVAGQPVIHLDSPLTVVRDIIPGKGPLGGLATGLLFAHCPWVLLLAGDLPFVKPELLSYLAEKTQTIRPEPAAVIPVHARGWEPLTAVYSRTCLKPAQALLAQDRPARLRDLQTRGVKFEAVPEDELRRYDPELISFVNINTPEDFELAGKIFRKEQVESQTVVKKQRHGF